MLYFFLPASAFDLAVPRNFLARSGGRNGSQRRRTRVNIGARRGRTLALLAELAASTLLLLRQTELHGERVRACHRSLCG